MRSTPKTLDVTPETSGALRLLSGALLLEAAYCAIENRPDKCYIKHRFQQRGIPAIVVISKPTPEYGMNDVRDNANLMKNNIEARAAYTLRAQLGALGGL